MEASSQRSFVFKTPENHFVQVDLRTSPIDSLTEEVVKTVLQSTPQRGRPLGGRITAVPHLGSLGEESLQNLAQWRLVFQSEVKQVSRPQLSFQESYALRQEVLAAKWPVSWPRLGFLWRVCIVPLTAFLEALFGMAMN